jgi:hypothetical protein
MEAEVLTKNYFFLQVFSAFNYEYVPTGMYFTPFLMCACPLQGVNCR